MKERHTETKRNKENGEAGNNKEIYKDMELKVTVRVNCILHLAAWICGAPICET
jgi:hypothetical protein